MKTTLLLLAGIAVVLASCAEGSSFHIPTSADDPPAPNAKVDEHCMQDCMADNTDPGLCHSRCAK
jgi:hypothetical protein